jgi:Glycosyl hydrolases family 6
MRTRTAWLLLVATALIGALTLARISTASAHQPIAHAASDAQQCAEPYPAQRDRSNPLDLPTPPGANPLTGARFFIPGPAHGAAAGAVAQLMGLNPKTLPDSESWASLKQQLSFGPSAAKLAGNPSLAHQVAELSKIANEPEAQRFSIYSEGGGPGAIFGQAEKIFCHNMTADPGSIPIINTYFLHPALGGCPTPVQVRAYGPTFRRRIDEMAAATDRRPAVYLLELDALGSSSCIEHTGSMPAWEADLRYELHAMAALPHTVVYVEGGYSDSNSAGYTAKILNAIGVNKIRGFFTNDTHENWTINEVKWAQKVSRLTHGAHFIVNTAENGNGPKANRNRVKFGNNDLCNPPGRALGPMDTTDTGFAGPDAFLWTHPPGNSSGSCGGGPATGTFWAARAVGLGARANQRLGVGFPARPY